MSYNKEELLKLPVDEQLEIVEALWDNIDEKLIGSKLLQKEVEDELNKRINEMTRHPERMIKWEDVKAKMKNGNS